MVNRKRTYTIVFSLLIAAGLLIGIMVSKCLPFSERQEDQHMGSAKQSTVDTPYKTIVCPGLTTGTIRVNIQDGAKYTVEFFGKTSNKTEYHLFDIWFSENSDQSIGQIEAKNNELVYIGITSYPLENDEKRTAEETNAVYAMQELLNNILEDFEWIENEPEANVAEPVVMEDVVIDTPYIPLVYPGKWADKLYIEEYAMGEMYQVEFYGMLPEKEIQHLFTIQFGAESEDGIGVVYSETGEEIPVNLIMGIFNPDKNWKENDILIIYAMQEEVNYLIDNIAIEIN